MREKEKPDTRPIAWRQVEANSFCMFCVGRDGTLQDIYECPDKHCPFYPIRQLKED